MEKYTKWRDGGTGIAPFLPVAAPDLTALTALPRLLLALFKLPILCAYLLSFLLVETVLGSTLGLVFPPGFYALRSLWARLLLLVVGIWDIPTTYEGRGARKPIKQGDLVVANWSSPIDVLLIVLLVPQAAFVRCVDEDKMLFKVCSIVEMALASLTPPNPSSHGRGQPLAELQREYKISTLVLFPEATPTNNRGLLRFRPILADAAHVLSIRYGTPACLTTPIPNGWTLLWACCSVIRHTVRIKGSAGPVLQAEWEETMARCARVPRTALSAEDKVAFLQAWRRRS